MTKYLTLCFSILLLYACSSKTSESDTSTIQQAVLWESGVGQYNNYRIPSLIMSTKGTLLAFCEGREAGDAGDIDLLLKRSEDNGQTWSEPQVVWNDGKNTCGNPCPVVDEETGRIWLFMTWNNGADHEKDIINKTSIATRAPYLSYSDDDGLTWSEAVNMETSLRDSTWGWYATGPGIGIQLKNGKHKGRMVVPANHSYDDPKGTIRGGSFSYGAHVLYSDDHGDTWNRSKTITPNCNESQVTELSDGTLVMNMRSYNDKHARAISKSTDGGATWSEITHDYQLVESKCQASIINVGSGEQPFHLFANPAVPIDRTHMTVKVSNDDCQTWSNDKLVYSGPSAYSCMTMLPNGKIGLLFENGVERPYEKLTFVAFDKKELFVEGAMIR